MRLEKNWVFVTVILASLILSGQGYLLIDDLNEVESSPGVAIIYPRAIGPEISSNNNDHETEKESTELVITETTSPQSNNESIETTTPLPTTTNTSLDSNETETTSSLSVSSTITVSTAVPPIPDTSELPASASAPTSVYVPRPRSTEAVPAINRVWHFNNRGINSEAVWSRVDRDSEAVESNPTPVYTTRANPVRSSPVFVRKPVFAAESSELNSLNSDDDLAIGEYPASNQRNLYYPDINRIQTPSSSVGASSSASSSASASASASSSSSSSSISNGFQTSASNINAAYGIKGGNPFLGNTWQPIAPSPVKAVRKVVLKSSKTFSEDERNQGIHSSQQPYRVRVVVQPNTKTPIQNNYLEKIQESSSATATAQASASAFNQKEYVEISTKTKTGTKIPPPPPPPAPIKAPIKAPQPPPAPIKSPPKPAPIKQIYPTKTPVRAAIRAPVFEQEYEQQHLEENPEPEPYSFNFNVNDDSGNGQFRREEGDRNGVVRGSYGYTDAWGLYRIVDYVADKNGFRATIRTNEPGLVERNPVTNEVDQPAHIQVAAEETPAKVVELMRLKKPNNSLI